MHELKEDLRQAAQAFLDKSEAVDNLGLTQHYISLLTSAVAGFRLAGLSPMEAYKLVRAQVLRECQSNAPAALPELEQQAQERTVAL